MVNPIPILNVVIFLFLSLLMRHIGASAVWIILPILLMDVMGAKLNEATIIPISNRDSVTPFAIIGMKTNVMEIPAC